MKMKNKFKDNFKINLYNFKIKGKIMCLFYFNHLFFLIVSRAEHYFNNNFQDLHILVKKNGTSTRVNCTWLQTCLGLIFFKIIFYLKIY